MALNKEVKNTHNFGHKVLIGILCLLAINIVGGDFLSNAIAQQAKTKAKTAIATKGKKKNPNLIPQIPKANRHQPNKVFLEYADRLSMDDKVSTEYQVLNGNVQFRKGDMFMYCDSAYFYEKRNSLDAFGNVRMVQGDTLKVFSDLLYYDGVEEIAELRYNVKLENRDVFLFTDSLNYDMVQSVGYYFDGGKLIDSQNELTSIYGQYSPDTKNAIFTKNVKLVNEKDNYELLSDTLRYNTDTHVARIVGPSTIVSDSNIIYSSRGWYSTNDEVAKMFDRSLIVGKDGQTITGDTLYYDRNLGLGKAYGNMVITDSVHSTIIEGDYGFHNEKTKTSFSTKRARMLEFSQKDTLYLHADTLLSYILPDVDSTRVMEAYHKARFWRKDMQGMADSIVYVTADSMMYMHHYPIIWSEDRQVFGNEIDVHMNDSTVDWARLPNYGFTAQHLEENLYNQLSGKVMTAFFDNGELYKVNVDGNVEALIFPQENDSSYNKLVNAESSFLTVDINKRKMEKLVMWPAVNGKVTPLFIAKKAQYYLPKFRWYEDMRPTDKDDIFRMPAEWDALLAIPEPEVKTRKAKKSKSKSKQEETMPNPLVKDDVKLVEPTDITSSSVNANKEVEHKDNQPNSEVNEFIINDESSNTMPADTEEK